MFLFQEDLVRKQITFAYLSNLAADGVTNKTVEMLYAGLKFK